MLRLKLRRQAEQSGIQQWHALCNEANAEKVTICHQEQQAVISGLTVGKCHMTQL